MLNTLIFSIHDANGNANESVSCDSAGSNGINFTIPEITATAIKDIDKATMSRILYDFVLDSLYKSILISLVIVISPC